MNIALSKATFTAVMIKLHNNIVIIPGLFIGLSLISCVDDAGQAEGIEPFFNITFIDNDSLAVLRSELNAVDSTISDLDNRITEIDNSDNKDKLLVEKDSLNMVKDSLEKKKTDYNNWVSDVNRGLIELSSVNTVIPEVAVRSQHMLGINSNDTISRYITVLNRQKTDTLDLTYHLDLEFTENQMRAIATQLNASFHTFDSLIFSCTTCKSNEIVITVYF